MPDEKGDLLPAEQEKAIAWLKANTSVTACTFCKTNSWALGESIINLILYYSSGWRLGGPSIPALPIFCKKCGHMEFFSAVMMQLVDPAPKETAETAQSAPVEKEVASGQ